MRGLILARNESACIDFLEKMEGKRPLFICTIGTSETAKIPGISAAGRNPELTDYTPAADAELLLFGRCKCIPGVPVTPEGIPTPALITRSALTLAGIPALVVSGGVRVKPKVPFLDLGGNHGGDIRTGRAVDGVDGVIEGARIMGESLASTMDYLVIGESIPGGTTTALGVLLAMGVDAHGKVSSSLRSNPHQLKERVVRAGMEASGIEFGSLAKHPMRAISCLGDPMMAAFAGLVAGAADRVPVLMAGGTQMGAMLAIVKALKKKVLDNVAVGTTRWIIHDRTADLKGIVDQVADVPVIAADFDFAQSKFEGLRAYELGVVKEGVGAGGAAIAATVKLKSSTTKQKLLKEVETNYEQLVR